MTRRLTVGAVVGVLSVVTAVAGPPVGSSGAHTSGMLQTGEGDEIPNGPSGAVWVVNRDTGEVSVFDARSGVRLAMRDTGTDAHEVAIAKDAGKAYVTNETENRVSVLSTRTLDGPSISFASGMRPHHIEPSLDGETILVGLVGTNAVAVVDADTDQVVRTYTSSLTSTAKAHGPYLADDTIYVAHETGDEVTGIDIETGAITTIASGILQATEVLPDRKEGLLYVAARGEGTIKRIDLETGQVDSLSVGVQPETLLLTSDGRTLIVSLRGTPARLAFIDTRTFTFQPEDRIDLAGPGTFGDLAAMSNNGRFVYATFDRTATGFGGIAVVDVKRRAVIDTWDYPEAGRLHGVAFTLDRPR